MSEKPDKNVAPFVAKNVRLARSDKPPSLLKQPVKPDADIKLWMTYRDCRLQQFIASR